MIMLEVKYMYHVIKVLYQNDSHNQFSRPEKQYCSTYSTLIYQSRSHQNERNFILLGNI